jgi:thiol-disulfide isomerase/thioredoxin
MIYRNSGFLIFIAMLALQLHARESSPEDSGKKFNDYPVGKIDRIELQSGWPDGYFRKEYASYMPEAEIIGKLKNLVFGQKILIVMAFWCSDSHQQVPRFYKLLDQLRYHYGQVEVISVDRNKMAGELDITPYNIERVPTFIFYEGSSETGRIIETPDKSLEADMLKILS